MEVRLQRDSNLDHHHDCVHHHPHNLHDHHNQPLRVHRAGVLAHTRPGDLRLLQDRGRGVRHRVLRRGPALRGPRKLPDAEHQRHGLHRLCLQPGQRLRLLRRDCWDHRWRLHVLPVHLQGHRHDHDHHDDQHVHHDHHHHDHRDHLHDLHEHRHHLHVHPDDQYLHHDHQDDQHVHPDHHDAHRKQQHVHDHDDQQHVHEYDLHGDHKHLHQDDHDNDVHRAYRLRRRRPSHDLRRGRKAVLAPREGTRTASGHKRVESLGVCLQLWL
mmetsp:Transcript_106080/g.316821  ORF Transcript_106080/g.316821 Transcript_106080/m.316821 type:complete len:269 (+) Transcript_106080:293-1099(+)